MRYRVGPRFVWHWMSAWLFGIVLALSPLGVAAEPVEEPSHLLVGEYDAPKCFAGRRFKKLRPKVRGSVSAEMSADF